MHEIPEQIKSMWTDVNAQIENLRESALATERAYFALFNFLAPTSTLEIAEPGCLVVENWPQDLDPILLADACNGKIGKRYSVTLFIRTEHVVVEVNFAPNRR